MYLPPLRDASQGLKPGRSSQLARLLQLLADEPGRKGINEALQRLDDDLRLHPPIVSTQNAIEQRFSTMLGKRLAQVLEVGLSATDFQRLSSRLSLLVDEFEIEHNGLGFNNLIFMAVVLSELAKNPEASYRSLIVEEPEAHLHPQLQSIFGEWLVTNTWTGFSPSAACTSSVPRLEGFGCRRRADYVVAGPEERQKLDRAQSPDFFDLIIINECPGAPQPQRSPRVRWIPAYSEPQSRSLTADFCLLRKA